ncbi:MAG TPA: type II toxin-antitoxin system RelE/ParE family toxin, partial [Verrucomicrobiae bacterium]|nr:type II toxin-antitoxin system RelE/ParE family toxin [Verrucomicrobiae bacterium]
SYIAGNNPDAADQVESDILASCRKLASHPELGHKRPDLTPRPMLFYTVRATYLIVFDPASTPLQILRILHGARDSASELR